MEYKDFALPIIGGLLGYVLAKLLNVWLQRKRWWE